MPFLCFVNCVMQGCLLHVRHEIWVVPTTYHQEVCEGWLEPCLPLVVLLFMLFGFLLAMQSYGSWFRHGLASLLAWLGAWPFMAWHWHRGRKGRGWSNIISFYILQFNIYIYIHMHTPLYMCQAKGCDPHQKNHQSSIGWRWRRLTG